MAKVLAASNALVKRRAPRSVEYAVSRCSHEGVASGESRDWPSPEPGTLGERIAIAARRIVREGSLRDLAAKLGVSHGTPSNWISGKSSPNLTDLVSLVRLSRVNGHWMLTGEGQPDLLIVAAVGIVPAEQTPTPAPISGVATKKA